MSDRERQRQLDGFVARFLEALEDGDFDAQEEIWLAAATDPELEAALTEAASMLAAEYQREFSESAGNIVEEAVRLAMPTVDVLRDPTGPVTIAEVAEHIRRTGSPGLSSSDLALNDKLSRVNEPVPQELGLSAVQAWGSRYGMAPASYWKLFRQAALSLKLRRESDSEYRHAARPRRPKKPGGQ